MIVNGIVLGSPGAVGSAPIIILFGKGAPSGQTLDAANPNPQNAQLGSLFIDYQTPALYFKTGQPNTWTQITIP